MTPAWRRRGEVVAAAFTVMLVIAGACSGGDDDGTDAAGGDVVDDGTATDDELADEGGDGEPPADLPAECNSAPFDIELTIDSMPDYAGGVFTVDSALGVATPIVPNGDGSLDDLEMGDFTELAAETDLLLYTQWIGDHPFDRDSLGMFSGPEPPEGSVTFALTVVPPTEAGLAVGDVVDNNDEIAYDAITTFGTAGVFFQPAEGVDTFFLVDNLDEAQGGTAEILYVDDTWVCIRWDLAGETSQPQGTYSLSGVVSTPLERARTPFT